jgi:anthranilate phosphoribosyltransferase
VDELAALWRAIMERDTNKVYFDRSLRVMDNAGTGMDRIKTFNISSVASVVAASRGAHIARHASRAITSRFGSVDLLEQVGIGVDVDVETVAASVVDAGVGLFNGASPLVHPLALGRILGQISFGSILNLSASLANPASPRFALRGVSDPSIIDDVAMLLSRLGYERAIVLHGLDGAGLPAMDEASVVGRTVYAMLDSGKVTRGFFDPEDFGLHRAEATDIMASGDIGCEVERFHSILSGKAKRAQIEVVALNSALALYVDGRAESIDEGILMSMEALCDGSAKATHRRWVGAQNLDPARALAELESREI